MSLVCVGDIELDYERSGSGPPLLLIMGMSGTSLHWGESFLAPLRESFETIVYDHRGVGSSTRLEGQLSIAQMAEDAAGLLAALEIDSAHVLGISMGGMVAQELALSHPECVRTLSLGCTYCGGEGSALIAPEDGHRLFEAMSSGDRTLALRTAWEINVSPALAGEQRAVAVNVIMAQAQAIAAHNTQTRLAGLRMPALIIHGTQDRMLPVANGRLIASLVPDARLEILDGVGHLFFWERPELSAQLLSAHAAVPA
jgi:3-oxoadipate enol-lactonase